LKIRPHYVMAEDQSKFISLSINQLLMHFIDAMQKRNHILMLDY